MTPSQAKRANQTLKGMIISVLLTVAVVVPIIALNPGSTENTYRPDIDVPLVAGQAAQTADFTPVAPAMPEGWYANFARWNAGTADRIDYWETGYVTTDNGFVWLRQSADATPGWVAKLTEEAPVTGDHAVEGTTWELRERGGMRTILLDAGTSTVLLSSDSGWGDLDSAARAVMNTLDAETKK